MFALLLKFQAVSSLSVSFDNLLLRFKVLHVSEKLSVKCACQMKVAARSAYNRLMSC